MRTRTAVCGILGLLAAAGTGCLGDSGSGPASTTTLIIDPGAGADLFLDTVDVDSVWVKGESLKIAVRYGGGCTDHTFRLVGEDMFRPPPGLRPALPPASPVPPPGPVPALYVYLVHDGHGDACRSLVSRTLVFDVGPASRLRREQLERDGFVTIVVHSLPAPGTVVTHEALLHSGVLRSPREDVEAERVAAFVDRSVTADEALYARIRDDLNAIRDTHGDVVTGSGRPLRAVTFLLPWAPRELLLTFDDTAADAVLDGSYRHWDALNRALGAEGFEILSVYSNLTVRLRFVAELNACALAAVYWDLPGLLRPPGLNRLAGDRPNIYAGFTESGMNYLVQEAWGDCPAGCLNTDSWFFESVGGDIVFIGRYDSRTDAPTPPWWAEAADNIAFYENECAGY
jgi:hypothetical protein